MSPLGTCLTVDWHGIRLRKIELGIVMKWLLIVSGLLMTVPAGADDDSYEGQFARNGRILRAFGPGERGEKECPDRASWRRERDSNCRYIIASRRFRAVSRFAARRAKIGTGRQRSDLVADGVPRSAGLVDIDPRVAVVMNDRGKGFSVAAAVPLLVSLYLRQ
jgi:hypothetical protein